MRIRHLLLIPVALLAAPAAAALVLVAAPTSAPVPAPIAAQRDPDARVDSIFAAWNNPQSAGCAVGVAQNGRTVLSRAYGSANLEHDIPNTPETVFEAGSVSKQFTAAAIVLLARQGKLSLDDDVRRHVPEVPDYGTPITLRHLLNHTSGLRDWGSVMGLAGWPRGTRIYTHAHALDVISRQRSLNFTPGAEYSYSNTGYNLLAMIVERVSGVSFAEFSRRELFEPLGMTRTQWRDDFTRTVKGRASAYTLDDGAWHLQMPFENVHGNGGLLTTVGDLLRWNQALDSGTIAGLDALETQGTLSSGRRIDYALGLYVVEFRGLREVSHGGATAGYRAFLARYPEAGVSVALLCNAANATPELATRTVSLFMAGRLRPEGPPALAPAVAVQPAELERRTGLYRSRRTGAPLRLVMADGKLRTAGGTELVPIGGTAFRYGSSASRVEFADGPPVQLRLLPADGDTVVYDPAAPADSSAANLATYAGEYRSDEAEATYTAAVVEGRLVLRMRPNATLRLSPTYADAFAGPGGSVVRFVRGADGRVQAFTLGTERVRELRFDRIGG
ncbi:MAG TPA: serine hydrolase domain-containing protein [Longimicrobium sp.]|jgi:CubicO group peptidase (beta-lactamase class C family)|uniref:serine hydrolase domain-containing protein n=1 Tax=Longimicrobium sp. TaxID=2029185 RepID=UPI002EDB2530